MASLTFQNGSYRDMVSSTDDIQVGTFLSATITGATDYAILMNKGPGYNISIYGRDLSYSNQGQLIGGIVDSISIANGFQVTQISNLGISGVQVWDWLVRDATEEAMQTMFGGADRFQGSQYKDLIRGYGGDDLILGYEGSDSLFGGAGNDTIQATVQGAADYSSEFLRGEQGNDSIVGGSGFDDIHGNEGDDTALGGDLGDWVVGGQGNDLLVGGAHGDIVYGNLGDDTLFGDHVSGAKEDWGDWVRGGQGNDSISAGGGNDLIWGDRGDDTISGGSGADTFHFFAGAGIDRILDFKASEGDKVVLDFSPAYTVRQDGTNTVIDLGNGDQMVLVDVSLTSLPVGWIS